MRFSALILWFNNWSIRRKLIATFLVVTLIPLGFLTYLTSRSSRLALTQAANRALLSAAFQTAESIDNFISTELEIIQVESQFPLFDDYLNLPPEERKNSEFEKQIHDFLQNLILQRASEEGIVGNFLLGLSLLDRTGTVILDIHPSLGETNPYIGADWSQRSFYIQSILLGIPFSSPVELSDQEDETNIYFSARITNELNHPLGVLVAHYDGHVIQEIISEKNDLAGIGSFSAVFDENLIYLAHGTLPDLIFTTVAELDESLIENLQRAKRLPNIPASEFIAVSPGLQAGLQNALPVFSAPDPITGDTINLVAVARLEYRPWQIAFFQPEEIYLGSIRQQTANILLFSSVITLLSLGAGFLASQGLSIPITRLTGIAEKVMAGNLSVRAEVASKDEIGILAQTFNEMTSQLHQTLSELEERITKRTNLLHVSGEVGQAASASLNTDELIHTVVNLITDRFGYYYAAIFLVDAFEEWAELKDATGSAGKTLLERKHKLEVGGRSMVGASIATRQARIALDVGDESIRFNNPLLPETRSEIALPLIAGEEVIGALDVQSTQEAAFTEQDIETLQNMANQVAIAIQNARFYQQAQQQLIEISRLNQTLTREGWQSFFSSNPNPVFQYSDNQFNTPEMPVFSKMEHILNERELVFDHQGDKATLSMPLIYRNQVIGMLNLKSNKGDWSQDELMILNEVTRQAALALENARLVEASQKLAIREQNIHQISSKIHHSANFETILKTTLSELATVLNVQEANIQLSLENPASPIQYDSES